MAWNSEGETLAMITESSLTLFLWDAASKKVTRVDSGLKEPLSHLSWDKNGRVVAVGSCRGNALLFQPAVHKKVSILGKHSKKIISGAWSNHGLFALISEDRTLTLNNMSGETLIQTGFKGDPSLMQLNHLKSSDAIYEVSTEKTPRRSGSSHVSTAGGVNSSSSSNAIDNCISIVLNRKVLYFINIHDSEKPISINFKDRYGIIIDYIWLPEPNAGVILLGFSEGIFSFVSTSSDHFGQEVSSFRGHKEPLLSFSYSFNSKKLASCAGNT